MGWFPFPSSLQFSSVSLPLPPFLPSFFPFTSAFLPFALCCSLAFLSLLPLLFSSLWLYPLSFPFHPQRPPDTATTAPRQRILPVSSLRPFTTGLSSGIVFVKGFVSDNLHGFKLNLRLHQISWLAVYSTQTQGFPVLQCE